VLLQAVQAVVQVVAQQTPSAQWVDVQSVSAVQPAPFACLGFAPQLEFMHTAGDTQSVPPAAQVVRHAGAPVPVPQLYGVQSIDFGATHAPWPSHAEPGARLAPLQAGALHWVPAGQRRQAPLPSQVPS
jgi:hypothetical protein